ncbi:MAG: hypothetical protein D6714_06680 [Bacteroidetes bacterium]|nr:MAG: hypothetical protein D6714_06680 [Bacteroidota bacterium]
MMKKTNFLLLLLAFMVACASPMKLAERGAYDDAIDKAVKKLKGKKKKKAEHVAALEKAFFRANSRDMKEAERLKKEEQEENWIKIDRLYKQIERRQRKIEPLLPLYDENGRKADFKFVHIEDLQRESKERIAELYYQNALDLLKEAENGDRFAARKAIDELRKIEKYYKNYRDSRSLQKAARELGMTHVLIEVRNESGAVLPPGFEEELLKISTRNLNSKWKDFDVEPQQNTHYHYRVALRLQNVDVSPERVKEREYTDEKEVEDGFDYVYDENGNVKKDSSGNDIKVPATKTIRATVHEIYQSKAAIVGGLLDIYDDDGNVVHSEPISVEAVFENYASRYEGDKRALSKESKKRIGNEPLPFPPDEVLLLDAAKKLKDLVKRKVKNDRIIK